jgi:NAD(P)-dependent dehydrogenase (short-subunit alcohol dehydrogenase family)
VGRVQDKVCLITGAGSDRPRDSTAFAREGARVVVADVSGRPRRRRWASPRPAAGGGRRDVADAEDRGSRRNGRGHGRIDVLFNNAGIPGSAMYQTGPRCSTA